MNRIHYFPYVVWIFLIIVFWNLLISLYLSFAERLLILYLNLYIEITLIGEPSNNGWYLSHKFDPLPKYNYDKGDIQEYSETYVKAIYTHCFGAAKVSFKPFQKDCVSYINNLFIISFCKYL